MSNYKTVSELLRECAEADFPLTAIEKKLGCSGVTLGETVNLLADEIDREKREIAERYACQSWMNPADAIAKLATGEIEWAELQQAIDRYYFPRPLFEDGEPVQFGEMAAHPILDKPSPIKSIEYFGDGSFALWFDGTEAITGYDNGERVRRPEPRVLDADGVPIKVGDTVWNVFDYQKRTVIGLRGGKARTESRPGIEFFEAGYELTHREPDTQERIDEDAIKAMEAYWGCMSSHCFDCPAKVDEKRPFERYETGKGLTVTRCLVAQRLDLLRRQRELDGRDA